MGGITNHVCVFFQDPAENRLGASSKHKKAASKGKTGDSDSELESDAAAEEDDDDETAEALEPHIRNLEISAAAAGDDDADSSQYVLLRCAPHASKGVLKTKESFMSPGFCFFIFATCEGLRNKN